MSDATAPRVEGRRRTLPRSVAVALVGMASVVGCSSEASAPAEGGSGQTVNVDAADNSFRAQKVTVKAGTEIAWTNVGRNGHDIVPADGGDWGIGLADFGPDAVHRHVFSQAGTYRYYCSTHGTEEAGMVGTVVVVE